MFEHKRKYLMELLYNEIERHIVKKSWRYFITTRRGYTCFTWSQCRAMEENPFKLPKLALLGMAYLILWIFYHCTFLNLYAYIERLPVRSNENKSCTRVDAAESWEARVAMRVFSTLVSRSNENKSCMRVVESWARSQSLHESFLNSHAPVKREQELHENWWEVKSENAWEFSQLSCPGQTRTRVAWQLMRVGWILSRNSHQQLTMKI
jgi:hypothetical protein